MHAWMWWFLAAAGLLGVEMLTVDLFFLMAAGGAAAAGVGALTGISVVAQFLVFGVVSIVLIAVVRPIAIKHFRQPVTNTNTDALIGVDAYVVEQVDDRDGRVKVGGEIWSARSSSPSVVYAPGAKVRVDRIDGATVLVS
jgi:membrane protein implicated in regulation of membrane protease activity